MGKLFSEALLEELERHFKQDKKLVGTLQGVIQFNFLLNSRHGGTWYFVFSLSFLSILFELINVVLNYFSF